MTTNPEATLDVTDDAILNGRLRLYQPRRGHRFGHDAILLAAAVPAARGDRVAEFGAGVGAAGLALLARVPEIEVTLIEIDPGLSALARRNIDRNSFSGRARAVTRDVTAPAEDAAYDRVLMNPPFNEAPLQPSPDPRRRTAHEATPDLLQRWIGGARSALRDGGTVTLIWRAEGLTDILAALADGFGAVSILPVYPAPGRAAVRLIVTAGKGARAPLRMLAPLILNDALACPTADAEAVLRQGAGLPLRAP
ncbi:tRNA1(Val) (adenine(37)-N6)-methyltransferase [Pseudorhodoplanes sp.]|uniref:tRNA1(Val) (adenine(37)-N6)-methyltransferase n=1 Tax=Pseudorhodoplanes sp. TaxID=1934341 RepID=UPI00391C72FF